MPQVEMTGVRTWWDPETCGGSIQIDLIVILVLAVSLRLLTETKRFLFFIFNFTNPLNSQHFRPAGRFLGAALRGTGRGPYPRVPEPMTKIGVLH